MECAVRDPLDIRQCGACEIMACSFCRMECGICHRSVCISCGWRPPRLNKAWVCYPRMPPSHFAKGPLNPDRVDRV